MDAADDVCSAIVKKIASNVISTTEVADCLGKKGALPGVRPLNKGHFRVGRVFFSYAYNESNWELHEQLERVREGDIVVVETHNCKDRAIFGSLVTKFLLLYKGASAVVVNGQMRDIPRLLKENYPVWCTGITPVGCFNKKNDEPMNEQVLKQWKENYGESIAVCDDAGVVIIPKAQVTQEFSEKLDFIELQEDIWAYCTNTKKWSTYETVCLKKYLQQGLIPEDFSEKFKSFVKKTSTG